MSEENDNKNKGCGKNGNLIPLTTTKETQTEEQRLMRSKGGKARQEQVIRRKTMKEDLKELLNVTISKEQAEVLLGDDAKSLGNDLTMQRVLLVRASQKALQDGDMRALEFLRDTVGDSPKMQSEIQLDVISDADRALIDKLNQRIG